MMRYEWISEKVIGAAIEVHRELGPGLLESAYEECMSFELGQSGLGFKRQSPLRIAYKGVELDCGYRLDFLIEDKIVVELKSVDRIMPVHEAQLISYLKLSGCEVGLLINFNVTTLKQGVKRRIFDHDH